MKTMYRQYQSVPGSLIRMLDYDQLSPNGVADFGVIESVCRYFSLSLSESQRQQVAARIGLDAKMPEQVFMAAGDDNKNNFCEAEVDFIQNTLVPDYQQLRTLADSS